MPVPVHPPRRKSPGRLRATAAFLALACCAAVPAVAGRAPAAARGAPGERASLADSLEQAVDRRDHAEALRLACLRFARLEPVSAAGDPAVVEALLDLGAAHRGCGVFERAEVELRAAVALADSPPGAARATRARARLELGLLCKDTGRGPEARALFERAWDEARGLGAAAPRVACPIARALGHWELRWGGVRDALPWFERARDLAERIPSQHPLERIESETWLGFALLRAGRHDEAANHFRRAIELLPPRGGRDAPAIRSALDLLAVTEAVRGHDAAAESLLRRSTRLADDELSHLLPGFGVGTSHPSLRLGLVDLLLRQGRGDEAWEETQVWSGWVTDAMLANAAPMTPVGMPPRDPRLAPPAELDQRLRRASPGPRGGSTSSDPDGGERSLLAAIAERAALEARLLGARRERRPSTPSARAPVLPALQRVLARDEALVGWTYADWDDDSVRAGRHAVWGYVVRRTGPVRWVPLGSWKHERELQDWLADLDTFQRRLEMAAGWSVRVPDDPALDSLGARLHQRLVSPLMPHLVGVRRIVAVYQVLHHWIPLECLRGPDGRQLVDRYEIAYTPSARTFVELRARARRRSAAPATALVVGDPDYSGRGREAGPGPEPADDWTHAAASTLEPTLVRSVLSGARPVAALPRLPQSRAEALRVAASFPGATLLLGASATRSGLERLRRDGRLARFSLLHFATHALVDVSLPERSAIALAAEPATRAGGGSGGGLLRADEVLERWKLDADLVVLSSCQTAGGRFTWSAQSLGLVQSFLGAGARSLLISPWKVDDLATRALMEEFSERLAGASGPARDLPTRAAALGQARRALRDFRAKDGSRPFAHPVYWAAFILVGDPGRPPAAGPAR